MSRVDGIMRWVQSETGSAIYKWAVGFNAIAYTSGALSVLDIFFDTRIPALWVGTAVYWLAILGELYLYRADASRQAAADASGQIQANPRWDQSEWRLMSCLFGLLPPSIFLMAGVHQNPLLQLYLLTGLASYLHSCHYYPNHGSKLIQRLRNALQSPPALSPSVSSQAQVQ